MEPVSFGVFDSLVQYGVLGLVVLALGGIVWYLFKRQLKNEEESKARNAELQAEINRYIREDQKELKDVIINNTNAFNNNTTAFNSLKDAIVMRFNTPAPRSRRTKDEEEG